MPYSETMTRTDSTVTLSPQDELQLHPSNHRGISSAPIPDPIIPCTSSPSPTPSTSVSPTQPQPVNYLQLRSTLKSNSLNLPPGCTWGPILPFPFIPPESTSPSTSRSATSPPTPTTTSPPSEYPNSTSIPTQIIWVDFPPNSPENPFHFSPTRKRLIVAAATFFTFITAFSVSAYSIGVESMCQDLHCTTLQQEAGLGLYPWGFGIAPLVLAPISEEFGRRWPYLIAAGIYTIFHLGIGLAKNIGTVLVVRFIMGAAGSIGATLVGGTISDIYEPQDRGTPMSIFAFIAMFGTGIAPVMMSFVEARPDLQWRWIQWIQMIAMAAYLPLVYVILRETRSNILLRRRAAKLRKARGMDDGGRYTARGEVEKVGFKQALKGSLLRPLLFLVTEPVVSFFSLWIGIGWAILYIQVGGLTYIFSHIYGFSITQVGLVYLTMCIGSAIGILGNMYQERLYRLKVASKGVEARLYAPMAGGVALAVGCIWYGLTSIPSVPWPVPCVGLSIAMAGILTIYISCFVYIAECYGSYASSAIASQSFLRNMVGGAFAFFTTQMFETLTPRYALLLMGCIAALLAVVPFVAYYKGPEIRKRSRYSRFLMAEERKRQERDREHARASRPPSRLDLEDDEEGQEKARYRDDVEKAR